MPFVSILRRYGAPLALIVWSVLATGPVFAEADFDYAAYRPFEARIPALTNTFGFGIWGHFGVLVDANGTARVYDLSDALHPQKLSERGTLERVDFASVSGPFLLVGGSDYDGDPSVTAVFRLSDNGTLSLISYGFLQEPGGHYFGARGFATWGDRLFIAGNRSFGTYPNIFVSGVGLVLGPPRPVGLAMKDNRLFVASENEGVAWFDFTPEGTVIASGNLGIGVNCRALEVVGGLLVVAEQGGLLALVDAGAAGGPVTISRTAMGGTTLALGAGDNNKLLLADAYLGVRRVDITNPNAPVTVDTMCTNAGATRIAGLGRYVLAASRREGVEIIDPDAAYARPLLATVPWITGAFARRGPFVFGAGVVDDQKCAVLADISDRQHPRLVGSSPLEWTNDSWVSMSDSIAAVSFVDVGTKLYSWDASRGLTGSADVGAVGSAGAINGTTLYLAQRSGAHGSVVYVIKARNVHGWQLQRTLQLEMDTLALALNGDVLWCAGSLGGYQSALCAYDVSDPAHPVSRGTTKVPEVIHGIAIAGDVLCSWGEAYLADGARLFDISRPNAVTALSVMPACGGVLCAALDSECGYLGTREGLAVVSIADPRNPRLLGTVAGPLPHLLLGDGELLASSTAGMLRFARQAPAYVTAAPLPTSHAALLTLTPNPFNPRLTVDIDVAREGLIVVEVYDVGGRRVAELFRSSASVGNLKLAWDGHVAGGRDAPSGAYFVRAVTGTGAVTRKAMLLR